MNKVVMRHFLIICLLWFGPHSSIQAQRPVSKELDEAKFTSLYGNYLAQGESFKIAFDTEGVIYVLTDKRVIFVQSKEDSYSLSYELIKHFDLVDANSTSFYCNIKLYRDYFPKIDANIGIIRLARPVDALEVQRILAEGILH